MIGESSNGIGSAALALQESQTRLRAVLANSPVILVAFDADGAISLAEGRDIPTFGLPRSIIGMGLDELAGRAPGVAAAVRKALDGERSETVLIVGGMHFDFRCCPTWDAEDQVVGVLGIASNITRDVLAEMRSGERESRWQSLVSQSADVALIADAASTAVSYVSSSVSRLFGWLPEQLIGRVGISLVHPDDVDRVSAALGTLLEVSGSHVTIEFRFECADGSYRWVEQTISNLSDAPGVNGLVGNMRDITERREAVAALRQRDRLTRALASKAADIALVVGRHGLVLYSNPGATTFHIAAEGDTIDFAGLPYIHADDRAGVRETMNARVPAGATVRAKYRLQAIDGEWRWVEHSLTNCVDDPDIGGLIMNLRDITEQVEAERALHVSELRYRLIAETAQEGIWATDPQGGTLYANQKMADLLGCAAADFYVKPGWELISDGTREGFLGQLQRRDDSGSDRFDFKHRRPDGSQRILRASVSPLLEDGRELGSLAMVSDITEARGTEEALRHRALHDPLTGLANRTLLIERLEAALERPAGVAGNAVALLVADIDQFKLVNDSFGHAAGDELLIEVAQRWRAALSEKQTFARFGGDEFVVICEESTERQAREVAAQLMKALEVPVILGGRTVAVSASIGIAHSAGDVARDANTLLRYADTAMYDAKAGGRSRVSVFTSQLANRVRDRLDLFNDLKDSLERQELEVRYQPLIELATGAVLGAEALCRWTHADRGSITPDVFIPLAEETGLIEPLDRWVLQRACADGASMLNAGVLPPGAYIAVNVSAGHLGQPAFGPAVRSALFDSGLPPSSLVLELTESAVMRDPDAAQIALEELRSLGIRVAIDDFGTGYSSLAYLRRFPVHTLKIDRSFVRHLSESADDRAIVTAVIDLAGALRLATLAEGVETPGDLALLQRLGCRSGQGFLWSPAVSPADLAALVKGLPNGRFPVGPSAGVARAVLPPPRTQRVEFVDLPHEASPHSGK